MNWTLRHWPLPFSSVPRDQRPHVSEPLHLAASSQWASLSVQLWESHPMGQQTASVSTGRRAGRCWEVTVSSKEQDMFSRTQCGPWFGFQWFQPQQIPPAPTPFLFPMLSIPWQSSCSYTLWFREHLQVWLPSFASDPKLDFALLSPPPIERLSLSLLLLNLCRLVTA
jgi:hypothetical protein